MRRDPNAPFNPLLPELCSKLVIRANRPAEDRSFPLIEKEGFDDSLLSKLDDCSGT